MKKNTVKRSISMVLAMVMSLMLCIPAFAAESTTYEETVRGVIDASERQSIYEQLEAQEAMDAVHTHEYICSTTTTNSALRGSDDEYTNVYSQYGGTLEYRTKVSGIKTDVAIT